MVPLDTTFLFEDHIHAPGIDLTKRASPTHGLITRIPGIHHRLHASARRASATRLSQVILAFFVVLSHRPEGGGSIPQPCTLDVEAEVIQSRVHVHAKSGLDGQQTFLLVVDRNHHLTLASPVVFGVVRGIYKCRIEELRGSKRWASGSSFARIWSRDIIRILPRPQLGRMGSNPRIQSTF